MGLFGTWAGNSGDGQAHQEGWNSWEIWHPLWCFPQKDHQENGGVPAWQIHMQLLWQGCHEEESRWSVELQKVWQDCRWRSLCVQHNRSSHSQVSSQKIKRNQGTINSLLSFYMMSIKKNKNLKK